jgi:polysaccharide deacetylase family protein (PEP-CTERM system associated)
MAPSTSSLPVEPASTRSIAAKKTCRAQTILSFDVEDHHVIAAAARMNIDSEFKKHSRARVQPATEWILDELARRGIKATFFIVGEIAKRSPELIRSIFADGHEIADHGCSHQQLQRLTPESFREDIRRSKNALEQASGAAVVGYRAPTFSIVRETAWAIDILREEGYGYDSSIYPVRHDRYGVPGAPRGPFIARGHAASILELPPLTMSVFGARIPIGGGGTFRLLPLGLMRRGLRQVNRSVEPPVATLYFHPWELDPDQCQLPLGFVGRWRTYYGTKRSRQRLQILLNQGQFDRAVDVARRLAYEQTILPEYRLGLQPNLQTGS